MPNPYGSAVEHELLASRHVSKAITGAAAGAVFFGGLGGMSGALIGSVLCAAANCVAGVLHERDVASSTKRRSQ